jgi:hypothetical protein
VFAGVPGVQHWVPASSERAVVISTQHAPAYVQEYFLHGRARMLAMLRAYWGPSPRALAKVQQRYGATDLWVRRSLIARERNTGGFRWPAKDLPYGRFVQRLLAEGRPAALDLPAECRRFKRGPDEVYDVDCVVAVTKRPDGRRDG